MTSLQFTLARLFNDVYDRNVYECSLFCQISHPCLPLIENLFRSASLFSLRNFRARCIGSPGQLQNSQEPSIFAKSLFWVPAKDVACHILCCQKMRLYWWIVEWTLFTRELLTSCNRSVILMANKWGHYFFRSRAELTIISTARTQIVSRSTSAIISSTPTQKNVKMKTIVRKVYCMFWVLGRYSSWNSSVSRPVLPMLWSCTSIWLDQFLRVTQKRQLRVRWLRGNHIQL